MSRFPQQAKLPLVLLAAFAWPFAHEFWIGPNLGKFGTCRCPSGADREALAVSGLSARTFPLRVVDDHDLHGRVVYEIDDVGVSPSRHSSRFNRELHESGVLCRHESFRANPRDGTARLATKRDPDSLPEIVDRIAKARSFMPFWDELIIRTRREPGAAAGQWETVDNFTVANLAEAMDVLQSRYPAACELPDFSPGPLTKSAALRTLDGSVVTLRLNYWKIASNSRYAMVLRCYDANDQWSWQATDLPPGTGSVWACDLDRDGTDEAITVVWHDHDVLFVQVRRRMSG